MSADAHCVAIVVELDIKLAELASLANRMPVWIAETVQNGHTVEAFRLSAVRRDSPSHMALGAITTFVIDPNAAPEAWVEEILTVIDKHHGFFSQSEAAPHSRSSARSRRASCARSSPSVDSKVSP